MNPSNEATVVTRDFPKENENLYKIARELFICIADHQNKDDNPELRQYKPDLPCCTHKIVGGVEYILRKEEDTSANDYLSNCIYEKVEDPGCM